MRTVGISSEDFADLQAQVLSRRAELERAWNAQQAIQAPTGAIAKDYPDLSSRAWDYAHESYSIIWPTPQSLDDKGRKLLQELSAMRARFVTQKIGVQALDATPPPAAPPVDSSHAAEWSLDTLLGDAKELALLVAAAWVFSQWRASR